MFSRTDKHRPCLPYSCTGAKSQIFGFVTAIIVMCVLLFLTPVFRLMPYNTMAAIIIVGVSALIEFGVAYELLRVHFRDFIVWMVAFLVTCFAGVEIGLASSIGLSIVITIAGGWAGHALSCLAHQRACAHNGAV